jgi:hypothetical protein
MVVVLKDQVETREDRVVEAAAVVTFARQEAVEIVGQADQEIEMAIQKEGLDQTDLEDIEDVNSILF